MSEHPQRKTSTPRKNQQLSNQRQNHSWVITSKEIICKSHRQRHANQQIAVVDRYKRENIVVPTQKRCYRELIHQVLRKGKIKYFLRCIKPISFLECGCSAATVRWLCNWWFAMLFIFNQNYAFMRVMGKREHLLYSWFQYAS